MAGENPADIVGQLVEEHVTLISLLPLEEVSLRTGADAMFRKTLLISAASYFEFRLAESLIDVFSEVTNHSEALVEFVRRKAVDRRYHDWCSWGSHNANTFFQAFGSDFQSFMAERVRHTAGLEESIRAFLEIGSLRNQLVHKNFAVFESGKTVDEIFVSYQSALQFVDTFPNYLREFIHS